MKKATLQTNLVCTECGNVQKIFRKANKMKKYGHLKKIWCFKCQKEINHFEIGNEEIEII